MRQNGVNLMAIIAARLMLWASTAIAFDDDLVKLQEQRFKLQQQVWKQDSKMLVNTSQTLLPQSSVRWRSFEAGGLTHLSDHAAMLKNSVDLIKEGLSGKGVGPDILATGSGQLVWARRPAITDSSEFLRGISLGLHFGGALTRDWETMQKGGWAFPSSYTLEALGEHGFSEIQRSARMWVNTPGSVLNTSTALFVARWTYGLPDATKALFSSNMPIDQRTALAIDSVSQTAAGYVWGPAGAKAAKAIGVTGRIITYPLFEAPFMIAAGQPVRSPFEIWTQELKTLRLGSGGTGTSSLPRMPNLLGVQQTRFESVSAIPINSSVDFGGHRMEQSGFIRETRIIETPTNVLDRALVSTNLISPSFLIDPMTSTRIVTRQSSIITREIVSPSANTLPIGGSGMTGMMGRYGTSGMGVSGIGGTSSYGGYGGAFRNYGGSLGGYGGYGGTRTYGASYQLIIRVSKPIDIRIK